jgi:hypothetical protein
MYFTPSYLLLLNSTFTVYKAGIIAPSYIKQRGVYGQPILIRETRKNLNQDFDYGIWAHRKMLVPPGMMDRNSVHNQAARSASL